MNAGRMCSISTSVNKKITVYGGMKTIRVFSSILYGKNFNVILRGNKFLCLFMLVSVTMCSIGCCDRSLITSSSFACNFSDIDPTFILSLS